MISGFGADVASALAATLAGLGVWFVVVGWRVRVAGAGLSRRLDAYVAQEPGELTQRAELPSLKERFVAPLVARLGKVMHGLLPDRQVGHMRGKLVAGGLPARHHLVTFLGAKALFTVGGTGVALVQSASGGLTLIELVTVLTYAALGFYLPGLWLGRRITVRRTAMAKALPDALDLLSIGVGAGLGLDGALLEVTQRWQNPLTEEFGMVLRDLRLGKSRRDAFRALASRTDSPDVRQFVTAILQADQLGTPLRETLHIQSEQIRLRRRQRAEEAGRKASVKMLLPMAGLIFPAMFIVLVGPAMPALLQAMGK